MKQIQIVETNKELSAYKRQLNFLKKQIYDNSEGMNRTTDGNSWSRFKANVKYWEEELAIFNTARTIVDEDQNDFIELVADLEDGVIEEECYICDGLGFTERIVHSRHEERYPDCTECFGTGNANVKVCPKCNGAKQLQRDGEAVDCRCVSHIANI